MDPQDHPSTMRRKAGAGRPPPEIGRITAAKALRIAIAEAAQDTAGLTVAADVADEARATLAQTCEALAEHPLIALVEGPDSRFGLVVLDPQTVAALIEMQTTGRVVPRAADPRAPTRTDAIMCADFIDRMLEVFERRAAEAGIEFAPALTGYRYAVALAEARAIPMTLEDVAYRHFAVSVDLGRGAKTGTMHIVLPFAAPGRKAGAATDASAFNLALQALVMESHAELRATLFRQRMTLSDISAWQPGMQIDVPREALAKVAIEDLEGQLVAEGRLGQASGHRAIRLAVQVTPALLPDVPLVEREVAKVPRISTAPQGEIENVAPQDAADAPTAGAVDTVEHLAALPPDSAPPAELGAAL